MRILKALALAGAAALALGAAAHAKPVQQPCPKPQAPLASEFWQSERAAFADFDRITAMMDAHIAKMRRQMEAFERAARAGASNAIAVGEAPHGFCAQSVEITRRGEGPPQVVRRTWGDCGKPAQGEGARQAAVAHTI